ncbi:hypothetical protein IMG5_119450, partial [Ichthyophthirius multifiliis]
KKHIVPNPEKNYLKKVMTQSNHNLNFAEQKQLEQYQISKTLMKSQKTQQRLVQIFLQQIWLIVLPKQQKNQKNTEINQKRVKQTNTYYMHFKRIINQNRVIIKAINLFKKRLVIQIDFTQQYFRE